MSNDRQAVQSRVVLTCGLADSGKTTFARQLEASGYTRISVDEEVVRRMSTGVLTPDSNVHLVSLSVDEDFRARLVDLVRQGRDGVVDYSFPTRRSRDAYRRLVEENGGAVELVYFRLSAEELHARARKDAVGASPPPREGEFSIDRYITGFEEPAEDEHAIVIDAHSGGLQ